MLDIMENDRAIGVDKSKWTIFLEHVLVIVILIIVLCFDSISQMEKFSVTVTP